MLGELFAAKPEDLDETLAAEGPYGRLPALEVNGLSEVSLATLGEILGVGAYEELVGRISAGPLSRNGDSGILAIPSELRDGLADTDDLTGVAERWAATEELALDGWETVDAITILREVRELATTARAADQALWYWWSL